MGPPLDEESFLLGVDDIPDENKETLVATDNQASFRRTTVSLLAAVTSLVVVGTVALHFNHQSPAAASTSLWRFPSLSNIFDSSKLMGNLMSGVVKDVEAKPETKKAATKTVFKATTRRQKEKVAAATAKKAAAVFQKKNSKMKVVKDSKTNLQWEDWGNEDDYSQYSRQMCHTSSDCHEGFCNMDEVDWGWCEPCSFFESREQCYNDGLPQSGADECASTCYGGSTDTTSTTYAGDTVQTFPISDDTGTLSDTDSATRNVKSYVVNACPGDVMHFSSCDSTSGDGFFNLYDLSNDVLVAVMDDSCGLFPAIDFTVPNHHCGQYRLDAGCYSYTECHLQIEGTLESAYPDPTMEPSLQPTLSPVRDHEDPSDASFPFTIHTGTMENTMTATTNVKEIVFEACGGEFISLDTCQDQDTNTGDSYMILYDVESNEEMEINDDACGLFSGIHRHLERTMGCRQFRLDAGCYSYTQCSYTIRGSVIRPPTPTHSPTEIEPETPAHSTLIGQAVIPAPKSSLPITAWTGDLAETMTATENSYVMSFEVCHGDTLFVDTCGNYSTGDHTNYGDSYIRLMNYGQIPHTYGVSPYAENDDTCGLFSSMTALIFIQEDDVDIINSTLGMRCKEFRVEAGCYSYTHCGYSLHIERTPAVGIAAIPETIAPTDEPTLSPNHTPGVVSFPFHIETGTMSYTDTATNRDTSTIIQIHVCPGDYVSVSSCGSYDENDYGNDSYLNVYDEFGTLIVWNDDSGECGLMSRINAQMPHELPGCELFTIVAGCYGEQECSYTLDGTFVNATSYDHDADINGVGDDDHDDFYDSLPPQTHSPTEAPTLEPSAVPGAPRTSYVDDFPFTVQTGVLGNTRDATENTKDIVFSACHGDQFELSSCGNTDQDTFFVVHDQASGDIRMEADDSCGDGSTQTSLRYFVVEPGCKSFRLSAGYYGTLEYEVGYTVTGTLIRAVQPTLSPTDAPIPRSTDAPTHEPTRRPISNPTEMPTFAPTDVPVGTPTAEPTVEPTFIVTEEPILNLTAAPSMEPTFNPTQEPTHAPIPDITASPTEAPVADATAVPTLAPTPYPTFSTTEAEPKTEEEINAAPEEHVVTAVPTLAPTEIPVSTPTLDPTAKPSMEPTHEPVAHPTLLPRADPTHEPTLEPNAKDPVSDPTPMPTNAPVADTTLAPTAAPTPKPSMEPTLEPVAHPTNHPVPLPTRTPVADPTEFPTLAPNHSLENFEKREKEKADGDVEPEPEWIQGDGSNATSSSSNTTAPEISEGNVTAPVESRPHDGSGHEAYKEDIEDFANICLQRDVPLLSINEGVVVNPGCVVFSDKDLTVANLNPQYDSASIVTFCFTREAGDIILDTEVLTDFDLIFEGNSLLASIGLGDDTQTTVFNEDNAQGDTYKKFLGSPARDGKYDLLYSLASNKYMGTGVTIGGNVFSVELKNGIETLSDCATTVKGTSVKRRKASRKHLELFMK